MADYLLQLAYTPEARATLIENPPNRMDAVRPVVESLGGSMDEVWFTFGEYDAMTILRLPDNPSAAAFSIAASAGGAIKAIKTTPLMRMEEGLEAMRKAGEAGYSPPGS